jgi:hypothetical protein
MNAFPQRLADEHAIVALTIAYTWALDSRDWPTLHQVFLPDATAFLGRELVGIEAIIERISSALSPLDASQHIIANHQVTFDGTGDAATCRCYLHAQHVRAEAAGKGTGGPNFIVAGRYLDDLVRIENGWRIKRRTLVVDWTEGNTAVAFR